jgi:hypothetical protein
MSASQQQATVAADKPTPSLLPAPLLPMSALVLPAPLLLSPVAAARPQLLPAMLMPPAAPVIWPLPLQARAPPPLPSPLYPVMPTPLLCQVRAELSPVPCAPLVLPVCAPQPPLPVPPDLLPMLSALTSPPGRFPSPLLVCALPIATMPLPVSVAATSAPLQCQGLAEPSPVMPAMTIRSPPNIRRMMLVLPPGASEHILPLFAPPDDTSAMADPALTITALIAALPASLLRHTFRRRTVFQVF